MVEGLLERLREVDEAYFKGEITFDDYIKLRRSIAEEATGYREPTEGVEVPSPEGEKEGEKPGEPQEGIEGYVETPLDARFRNLWLVALAVYVVADSITTSLLPTLSIGDLVNLVAGTLVLKALTTMPSFLLSYFVFQARYIVPKVLIGLGAYLVVADALIMAGLA